MIGRGMVMSGGGKGGEKWGLRWEGGGKKKGDDGIEKKKKKK